MAVVRAERQIKRDALPGVRKTAAETATSTGAGAELAKGGIWTSVARLGDTVEGIAVSQVARIKQEQIDFADQLFAINLDSQISEYKTKRMWGENGVMTRLGKDAMGAPEEMQADYAKMSGELAKGAKTPRQKMMAQRIIGEHGQSINLETNRHVANQMQKYAFDEMESAVKNNLNEAYTLGLDPVSAGVPIAKAVTAVELLGRKAGMGPEAIEEKVAEVKNAAIDGVITRLLVGKKDQEAKRWFQEQEKAGNITGQTLAKLADKVNDASVDGDGERAAAKIWAAMGPKSDTDVISLDKMADEARAMFPDDTAVMKATISALTDRRQLTSDGRRQRQDGRDGAIGDAIYRGANLDAVSRMPEFIDAPGDVKQKYKTFFKEEAAANERRAESRANRQYAEEGRAWTRLQREENMREHNTMAATFAYTDPKVLRAMSRDEIVAKLPELGRDNVRLLLAEHEQVQKSDAYFQKAVLEDDIFKEVAYGAGLKFVLDAPGKLTKDHKDAITTLKLAVKAEMVRQQVKTGAVMSREAVKELTQSVVDAHATTPGLMQRPPQEWPSMWRQGAPWQTETIRLTDIPDAERASIEAALKEDKQDWSAQAVVDAYMAKKRGAKQ